MLTDLAKKYYLENKLNCAQSILMAANDYYKLGLTENEQLLIAGFGGGMGSGKACGTLTGAIAVLGKMLDIHSETFRNDCNEFVQSFEKKLGNTECCNLIKKYKTDEMRCFKTVYLGAELLEDFISKKTTL